MTDAPTRDIDMRYVEPATAEFIEHLLREVRALPRVESAALAGAVPMGPTSTSSVGVRLAGTAETTGTLRRAMFSVVRASFFDTLRIPLRRGRNLEEHDAQGSAWVAVVNEAFAREFFPAGDALGQVIHLTAGPDEKPREIVGVVADFTQYTPRVPVQAEIYTSHLQQPREIPGTFQGSRFRPKLIVRTRIDGAVTRDVIAKIIGIRS
jgi:putative ABC transport system permease protein